MIPLGDGGPRALLQSLVCALAVALAAPGAARAGEARIAVAANFSAAAERIGAEFTARTGHRALFSFGSTGKLFTQIAQRAPFDVFLAADRERPARAVAEGLAVAGSRFTYAIGRLALYSRDPGLVTGPQTLAEARFARLALANPDIAPYGAGAVEALRALGLYDRLKARFVRGANIAQTYQFVATGNADLGFVAVAQIAAHRRGSRWIVGDDLHAPIAQDAVLLQRGRERAAALAFVEFLRGASARAVIQRFGYAVPGEAR